MAYSKISLTEFARAFSSEPTELLNEWFGDPKTREFLRTWEIIHNTKFKPTDKEGLNLAKWVVQIQPLGISFLKSRDIEYFAHPDIFTDFACYVSPIFKLYLIKAQAFGNVPDLHEITDKLLTGMKQSKETKRKLKAHVKGARGRSTKELTDFDKKIIQALNFNPKE